MHTEEPISAAHFCLVRVDSDMVEVCSVPCRGT